MYQYLNEKQKKQFLGAVVGVLGLLTIFLLIQSINSIKQFSYIGHDLNSTNVITVTGEGFVLAVPDTVTFFYSVMEKDKTIPDAQNKVNQKSNDIINALKSLGIADADIQTTDYSSYPTYEQSTGCPVPLGVNSETANYLCPPIKQILTGYEVNQTVTVKVRKTADAGAALTKVGELGATNISGLSFIVDNLEAVKAQARDKAIADAKAKAAVLAKSLGVKMTKIINFYENGNQPIYSQGVDMLSTKATNVPTVAPNLPVGQNKITSDVSITYELQ